jgi:hypothetical protein
VERFGLRVVVFAGGEPTVLKTDLFELISGVRNFGINSRMVTNASWATTDEKAEEMVSKLRSAGLNEINISVDDYHLPFIPLENISRAYKASKGKGFYSVSLATCSHASSEVTPERLDELIGERLPRRFDDSGVGMELPPRSEDGTIYMLSNSIVQGLGRAAREVPHSHRGNIENQELLDRPCPFAIANPAITPSGKLVSCCGFELEGNKVLDYGPVSSRQELFGAIDAANNDVLSAGIANLGPYKLLKLATVLNERVHMRNDYVSICEVCQDLVLNDDALETLHRNSGIIAEALFRAAPKSEACDA